MVLLKIFNWALELLSSASGTSQTPIPKSKETGDGWYYSAIVCLVLGSIFILFICIYAFVAKAIRCTGRFATPQFPALLSEKRRQIKRRKSKKPCQKRLTKAQRLLEVNRKWSAMFCSDNSDCEEPEDIATVPFGSLEITEVKKVSFRDTIQDVYFIESKEEMKRLEKLQSMGYDVTVTRPKPSARDHARKMTTEASVFEEKETVLAPALCSSFDNYSDINEYPDISPRALKKLVDATTNFQMGDAKIGSFENRIFKGEERLLEIPLLGENTV